VTFVAPGLYAHEKRLVLPAAPIFVRATQAQQEHA